jgi:hypothetical protein
MEIHTGCAPPLFSLKFGERVYAGISAVRARSPSRGREQAVRELIAGCRQLP